MMIYRQLGQTGWEVPQLGFGAMRLPMVGEGEQARMNRDLAIPMIHRAFAAGVNYIDTATMYCNNDGQYIVGEALKGWRASAVLIATWVILAGLAISTAVAATFRGASSTYSFYGKSWDQLSDTNVSASGRAVLAIDVSQWRHGETEHFILHYGWNGDKIARRAEEFYAEIREFFGNRPDLLAGRKSHIFALHIPGDWEKFLKTVGASDSC